MFEFLMCFIFGASCRLAKHEKEDGEISALD